MAVLTEEQSMLRDQARAWRLDRAPVRAFRRMRDSAAPLGYDPELWREMAEMGWAGVIVPEAYGGSDFGWLSLGLLLEETGRSLVASPLLASGVAAESAIVLGGSEAQRQALLPGIAAGGRIAALAVDEGPRHAPQTVAARAVEADGGYVLSGAKTFVLEGLAADLLVVSARTAGAPGDLDGITLFLVPAEAPGVSRKPLRLVDSRGAANVTLDAVRVGRDAVLGEAGAGGPLLDRVLDRARAGLAAEMLGTAQEAFEITLDYLKTRVQFGQLIGGFQALQHRAAKMYGELELSRSCVEAALASLDAGAPDSSELCSLAKAHVGDTLFLVSNELIQMHGGIGMTDAHNAGLYLKRARVAEAAFGGRAYHRERFARLRGY
jgi:alkylation response protein AidB-like acyl-CoA dehydrogenase